MVPEFTVCICTRNRVRTLVPVLEGLVGQTGLAYTEWEIVVVDNGSTDSTERTVVDFARESPIPVRVVRENQKGKPFARNRAVQESRGKYVVFTDDDVIIPSTWLNTLITTIRVKNADAVGGRVLPLWEDKRPPWLADSLLGNLGLVDMGDEARWIPSDNAEGIFNTNNVVFRRSVFDRWGLFRMDIWLCEDQEMFGRLLGMGARLFYEPRASLFHRIPPERLTKRHFCQWNFSHGFVFARIHDPAGACFVPRVPNWSIRSLLGEGWTWLSRSVRGTTGESFQHFARCVFWIGYVLGRSFLPSKYATGRQQS